MKKYLDWIVTHKAKTGLIVLGLFIIPLIIIHLLYKWITPHYMLQSSWSSGELITYIAGFEAFLGTVFLGVVAVRQNDKANEISKRMLANEEMRDAYERQPNIMINNSSINHDPDSKNLLSITELYTATDFLPAQDSNETPIHHIIIELINVSKAHAAMTIQKFEILDLNAPHQNLTYDQESFKNKKTSFNLASNQSICFGFLVDKERLYNWHPKLCRLTIKLFNSIGESYIEALSFIIESQDHEPRIEVISYYTHEDK